MNREGDRVLSNKNNSNFMIRRLHSLIAVIPVGIFVCVHMLLNSSVFISGNESYLALINFMKTAPFVVILEVVVIAIPIIFHGLYGIYIVYLAKNNALKYTYYRNWAFYLQRITALIVLVFLIWHVWVLRLSTHEPQLVINTLAGLLHNPVTFALYIIGVVASMYHFANGLFTFCITWGICVGDRSQKVFATVAGAFFVLISLFAIAILVKISIMPLA